MQINEGRPLRRRRRRPSPMQQIKEALQRKAVALSDGVNCIKDKSITLCKDGINSVKTKSVDLYHDSVSSVKTKTVDLYHDGVSSVKTKSVDLSENFDNVKANSAERMETYQQSPLFCRLTSIRDWYRRQAIAGRVCIGVVIYCLMFFSANAILLGNACGVFVNGQQIAVASDEKAARNALQEVIQEKSDKAGVVLDFEDKVNYRIVHAEEEAISSIDQLKESLNSAITFNTNAVLLQVDGASRICVREKEDAEELLAWLVSFYPTENGERISFKEQVELVETVVDDEELTKINDAKNILLYGSAKVEEYIVANGDNAWDIAAKYEMFPESLQTSNPGVDLWNLQIGQVLKLSQDAPVITVVADRQYTTDEEIPYTVEERSDDNLMPGEKKVIAAGEKGLRTVTYYVTKENGYETNRVELEQKVLREPSTEIVARGSQIVLASRGGSRLSWPCGGSAVSSYGMRSGRMHKGLDIAGGGTGSPIYAAASGTVIYTGYGYDGGYGNNIEISHGSGYVTKYAHLSTIKVNVGQTVERGEVIGGMGETGRAYGVHLHFEVHVNGATQNPSNYL